MTRILIGALSGWKYYERRQRCLATWMADADQLGVESVFLLGCPSATRPELIGPHALALPCPDDYPSLPQRTRWFCRWALEERCQVRGERCQEERDQAGLSLSPLPWDYLFKCDDDTYVSIPRLLAYAEHLLSLSPNPSHLSPDYVGAEWKPGVAYGSGGAGYFLSRPTAATVAERLTHTTGVEDLLVGKILCDAGIQLSIEPRLVPFGSMERRPRRDNDLITVHGCSASWEPSHAETGLRVT